MEKHPVHKGKAGNFQRFVLNQSCRLVYWNHRKSKETIWRLILLIFYYYDWCNNGVCDTIVERCKEIGVFKRLWRKGLLIVLSWAFRCRKEPCSTLILQKTVRNLCAQYLQRRKPRPELKWMEKIISSKQEKRGRIRRWLQIKNY